MDCVWSLCTLSNDSIVTCSPRITNNVAYLMAVSQMPPNQQTPPRSQGGGETQMSKWAIVPSKFNCTFMAACYLPTGPPPPSSTPPPPSLLPAVVTSSPPHLLPQAHPGNEERTSFFGCGDNTYIKSGRGLSTQS